jgi:glycosyltransferase involved in cell wall biosynthesis
MAALDGVRVYRESEAGAVRRAATGGYRVVICGLGGRIALPGAYLAARARGIPFILWATMWSHPRTPFHALSFLPARHLYRNADAVVTYGPHVSGYVGRYRRRGNVFEAPQAVDAGRFGVRVAERERLRVRAALGVRDEQVLVLYVGRLAREKGVEVLLRAWELANLESRAVLALVGSGPLTALLRDAPVRWHDAVPNAELPAWYAAADVIVVPSIRTATFVEPWALVVNEAMLQEKAVITSDAVGAAAGGLVRDGTTGLVVPEGDAGALADAIAALVDDSPLRSRLGASGQVAAAAFSPHAWADGMRQALASVGASVSQQPGRRDDVGGTCTTAAKP